MNPNRSPIEGGRRPGDDPFLPQSNGQTALIIVLAGTAIALVLWLLPGEPAPNEQAVAPPGAAAVLSAAEASQEGAASRPASVDSEVQAPGPGGWMGRAGSERAPADVGLAGTGERSDAPSPGEAPPPLGLSTTRLMGAEQAQRATQRTFQSRRRVFLVEAEQMLGSLPPENAATPEQRRDRRALQQLIQAMDSPAR